MPPTTSSARVEQAQVRAVRHHGRAPTIDLARTDRVEGRHRRPPHQRRRRAAEATPGQDRAGPRRDGRRQDLPGRDRHRPAGRPRRARRDRDRLGAGGAAGAAVRRPGHLLDRGAVAAGGARAPGRGRRRLYRARARDRLRQARRQGHGDRGRGPHPAALRRRADAAGRPAPAGARRRGPDAAPGRSACPTRATRCGSSRRARRRAASRPTRSWSPSAGAPGPRASAWNDSTSRWTAPSCRSTSAARTSMRNVWAIGDLTGEPMLAHRAMAQGEMVAEIDRRPSPRLRRRGDPRRLLHRSGDRHRRPLARRGAQGRPRGADRACSRSRPTAAP